MTEMGGIVQAPESLVSEVVVLGTIMVQPDLLPEISLEVDDFHDDRNQGIYRAMQTLYAEGKHPNHVAVVDWLNNHPIGDLDAHYVAQVRSVSADEDGEFEQAVELVTQRSFNRRFWVLADDIKAASVQIDDPIELADHIQEELRGLFRLTQDKAVMRWDATLDNRYKLYEKRMTAFKTGVLRQLDWPWKSWNRWIRPLREGTLALFAGLSGMGKTLLASHMAEHWAKSGFNVVFVHCELDHALMLDRQDARATGIPLARIEDGDLTEDELALLIRKRSEMVYEWPGNIHYVHAPGWSAAKIAAEVRKQANLNECDIFILDYLQKIPYGHSHGMNTAQQVGQNVDYLKNVAEDCAVSGVILSQYNNRAGDVRSVSDLHSGLLRDGGAPHEKSNLVVLMHSQRLEDDLLDENGQVVVRRGEYDPVTAWSIDKQTRGGLGAGELYFARWRGDITDVHWGG